MISKYCLLVLLFTLIFKDVNCESNISTFETSTTYFLDSSTLLFETTNTSVTTYIPSTTPQDQIGYFTSKNYPNPYDYDSSTSFTKTVPEGYSLKLVLDDLNIDQSNGDYLTITAKNDSRLVNTGIIYTGSNNSSKPIELVEANYVSIQFVVQERRPYPEPNTYRGFKITWEIIKPNITTTTDSPRPTTTPVYLDNSLTVYLSGKTPKAFADDINSFDLILLQMASEYCVEKNIPLAVNLTADNIKIEMVGYCLITWPDFENCVKLTFSIPVELDATHNSTYELTTEHLSEMWSQYSDDMLKEINMKNYKAPTNLNWLIWLAYSLCGLIGLIILISILWKLDFFVEKPTRRRLSEVDEIIDEKGRGSDSLYMSPHQLVPPLFDQSGNYYESFNRNSNNINRYPLYEPEWLKGEKELRPPSFNYKDAPTYENTAYSNDEVDSTNKSNYRDFIDVKSVVINEMPEEDIDL